MRLKLVLGPCIQLLQLLLVLSNRFGFLVDLPLKHSGNLKHVLFVERNVLGGLADILLEVEQAKSALLEKVVEVGDVVGLALLLLLNVLICH